MFTISSMLAAAYIAAAMFFLFPSVCRGAETPSPISEASARSVDDETPYFDAWLVDAFGRRVFRGAFDTDSYISVQISDLLRAQFYKTDPSSSLTTATVTPINASLTLYFESDDCSGVAYSDQDGPSPFYILHTYKQNAYEFVPGIKTPTYQIKSLSHCRNNVCISHPEEPMSIVGHMSSEPEAISKYAVTGPISIQYDVNPRFKILGSSGPRAPTIDEIREMHWYHEKYVRQ